MVHERSEVVYDWQRDNADRIARPLDHYSIFYLVWIMKIKIRVTEDSMGCLHLTQIKESYIDQIIEYLKDWKVDSDGSVLIQSDYDVESFYEDCSYRQRKDIKSGWGATMLFDAGRFSIISDGILARD